MNRPLSSEFPDYFSGYINLVPNGDFIELLEKHSADFIQLLQEKAKHKTSYAYAEGKWTVKQVVMHIIDVERVMFYRALVASRGDDKTIVYSMNDKLYAANSNAENLKFEDVLEMFRITRSGSLLFFKTLNEKQKTGIVHGNAGKFSCNALGYIILGHGMHHENILKERYFDETYTYNSKV